MTTFRPAAAEDAPILRRMLAVAADWRPGAQVRSTAEVMADPTLGKYVAGWPRAGDFGVVAEGEGPVGAAWWRFFTAADHGYGFVDAATPELSIGVVAQARGRGVGTLLLRALVDEARRRRLAALSLSVEPENPALSLYERVGFVTVAQDGGALTMTLPLGG